MNSLQLEVIPQDAVMTIKISTDLYVRIQQCLLQGLPYTDLEHFKKILKEIGSEKFEDPLSPHVHTLVYLLSLIESSAKDNNLIIKKNFDLDTQKMVD